MNNRTLFKNRIFSILLIAFGVITLIFDNDATFLIFALMVGAPLFFAKKNLIE